MEKEKVKGIPYGVASFEYPFSCVLWAIFWSFPLLFFVR